MTSAQPPENYYKDPWGERIDIGASGKLRDRDENPQIRGGRIMSKTEIIFEVIEDEADGGDSASALGFGIHTHGDSVEDIRRNVREAVDCYFDEGIERPGVIRLHFVRDEILAA